MATIDKDFKIKNGLIVEGATATVNGNQVLTENESDQYIIDLIGGEATSNSVANAVVLRDGNANFAANIITATLNGEAATVDSLAGHLTSELTEDSGALFYTDGRVKDVLVNSTKTNISITEVSGELHITAENGVADSTTDDLDEGTTNKYFTEARVRDALTGGNGIDFNGSTGDISVELGVDSGLTTSDGTLKIKRSSVDTWYDANGAAGNVASDLSTHEGLTSGVHGVNGNVVGTTDTQDLSNKRVIDTLYFSDGVTISEEGEIAVRAISHDFDVQANQGDLHLKTVAAESDVQITATYGDILLNTANGAAYYGSASAENEIATHGYVDNAVAGLDWKNSAHVKIDSNVSNLSDAGNIYDGHSLTTADVGLRVLLVGQSTASQNGIYTISEVDGKVVLTRSTDADSYTELLGAAIYIAEGTQYGSTSWVQSNAYLTDFSGQNWTQFSGQGSVTAGSGITVDGLEVSIDRTTVDDWYEAAGEAANLVSTHSGLATGVHGVSGNVVGTSDSQTLTNKTIDGEDNTLSNIGNSSLANSAITINSTSTSLGGSVTLDTDDISEGSTNQYYTAQRVRDVLTGSTQTNISITEVSGALVITAENGVDDSTTDDLEEGTNNHYFTDERAKDAAGELLANATKTNVEISYIPGATGGLTITAENGVADSDTDDLTEGSSNLYFTDTRAQDAVDGTTRSFTSINLNTYRTEEATQQYVASASTVTAHTFTGNKSVKYLVRIVGNEGGTLHSQITELLVTVDGNNNAAVTEYGTIYTSASALGTATVDYVGGEHRLRVTTAVAGAEVVAAATMMSWAD